MKNASKPFLTRSQMAGEVRISPPTFPPTRRLGELVSYYVVSSLPYNNVIFSDLYINIGFHPFIYCENLRNSWCGYGTSEKIENDVTWAHFCFIGEAEFSWLRSRRPRPKYQLTIPMECSIISYRVNITWINFRVGPTWNLCVLWLSGSMPTALLKRLCRRNNIVIIICQYHHFIIIIFSATCIK